MTRTETSHVLVVVSLLWPHSNLGKNGHEVLGMWHTMLGDLDAADVESAVRDLAATGREHAPPVGLVVRTVASRTAEAPDWDEAKLEILRSFGKWRPKTGECDPYAPPPPEYWSHPLLAVFMDQGGWQEWRMSRDGDGTFLAQQREAWKALAARAERGVALRAVGAPLSGGRRSGGLRKMKPLALPPGPGAA